MPTCLAARLGARVVPREKGMSVTKLLRSSGATFGYLVTREGGCIRHEVCRVSDDLRLFASPRMWGMVMGSSSSAGKERKSSFHASPMARAVCPAGEPAPR